VTDDYDKAWKRVERPRRRWINYVLALAKDLDWPRLIIEEVEPAVIILEGEAAWRTWTTPSLKRGPDDKLYVVALVLEWALGAVHDGRELGPPESWYAQMEAAHCIYRAMKRQKRERRNKRR
jgi:hypothetical protein